MSEQMKRAEHNYAVMEAERIATSEAYFKARPHIDNGARRNVFESGFDRGYRAAQKRIEHLEAQLSAYKNDAERYALLKAGYFAADFDYLGDGVQALIFQFEGKVSSDLDKTLDAALSHSDNKDSSHEQR